MHDRVELLRRCCGPFPTDMPGQIRMELQLDGPIVGVLPAREEQPFLEIGETPSNHALFEALTAARRRISFQACYCSVLGACWTSDLISTTDPTPIARCRPGPDDYSG